MTMTNNDEQEKPGKSIDKTH